ncbi:MAG: hypothetical protein M0C28_07090 [Candidatus Moduliflexus flocculans]|nr:hypothetical protein [Candidatus Moduliflexus flocculans]
MASGGRPARPLLRAERPGPPRRTAPPGAGSAIVDPGCGGRGLRSRSRRAFGVLRGWRELAATRARLGGPGDHPAEVRVSSATW